MTWARSGCATTADTARHGDVALAAVDRGSFLYTTDGELLARSERGTVRRASRGEWAEAAVAMNPALANPHIARFVPAFVQRLLLAPEDRDR